MIPSIKRSAMAVWQALNYPFPLWPTVFFIETTLLLHNCCLVTLLQCNRQAWLWICWILFGVYVTRVGVYEHSWTKPQAFPKSLGKCSPIILVGPIARIPTDTEELSFEFSGWQNWRFELVRRCSVAAGCISVSCAYVAALFVHQNAPQGPVSIYDLAPSHSLKSITPQVSEQVSAFDWSNTNRLKKVCPAELSAYHL